jgi:uncharacterized protein (TIGR03435 family)
MANTSDLSIARAVTILDLLSQAYEIPRDRITAPGWARRERYDVRVKVPPGASKPQIRVMLQNLLAEQFQFSVRREQKQMRLYELVVFNGEPKLPPATTPDPEEFEHPGFGSPRRGADGYPDFLGGAGMAMINSKWRMRRKITMEGFARILSRQLRRPVNDRTGLTGEFDISLYWDAAGKPQLLDAMKQQLGLKLEPTTGPMEILVVTGPGGLRRKN